MPSKDLPIDTLNVNVDAPTTVVDKETLLIQRTKEILAAIKNNDYDSFSRCIHPLSGIRFSPCAYITKQDVLLSRNQLLHALEQGNPRFWGTYSGSGDSIVSPLVQYFKRFVYDVDFINAEIISVNASKVKGSAINNQEAFYKGLDYTESYFSGFDKKYAGMDWRALRLIFREYQGNYFLTGIVHDEWTP